MSESNYKGRPSSPVREGEEMTVKIDSLGREGDGIARVSGLVVFVPNTKVGDEVRIKITKVGRSVAFGEKLE